MAFGVARRMQSRDPDITDLKRHSIGDWVGAPWHIVLFASHYGFTLFLVVIVAVRVIPVLVSRQDMCEALLVLGHIIVHLERLRDVDDERSVLGLNVVAKVVA